jgi:NTP pyrophosphatase (non-canonical NTP hydrolase)
MLCILHKYIYGGVLMEKFRGTEFKSISLPRLNNLKPNIESTALKLMEEAGELAQLIGKYRGLNGENCKMEEKEAINRIAEELLDVAQVAISMMFVLEESYSIDIQKKVNSHIEKLIGKGYIKG